jgi:hypothetical protein
MSAGNVTSADVSFCTDTFRGRTYAGEMKKQILAPIALALALVGIAMATPASAQTNLNNRTVLTFSQPVEVPGKVLPAGTYTFELNEAQANRHIVQIMDAGGTKVIALVLAVPNRRLTVTEDTVVRFAEVAPGQPQAMRAWFYPGQTVGQEMVYPKTRAQELATSANLVVPSVDDTFYDSATVDTMKTVEVVPVNPVVSGSTTATQPQAQPETRTPPVTTAPVTTAPTTPVAEPVTPPPATTRDELPRTASPLPLIALFGFVTLALGLALRGLSTGRSLR